MQNEHKEQKNNKRHKPTTQRLKKTKKRHKMTSIIVMFWFKQPVLLKGFNFGKSL